LVTVIVAKRVVAIDIAPNFALIVLKKSIKVMQEQLVVIEEEKNQISQPVADCLVPIQAEVPFQEDQMIAAMKAELF